MAALIMLVQENWQIIEQRFTDVGNAFHVTLFMPDGKLSSPPFEVEKNLIRGAAMANLSGDVEARGGARNVYVEVWPVVAELAYAQYVENGYADLEPTNAKDIWFALTGKDVSKENKFSTPPTSQIQQELAAGNQVYIGSRSEYNSLPENQTGMVFHENRAIVGHHAYVVLDIYHGVIAASGRPAETIYQLRNPWGITQLVPEEFIDDLFYRYFVFYGVDLN